MFDVDRAVQQILEGNSILGVLGNSYIKLVNEKFKDGDTPKSLDDNATYEIIKVGFADNKDSDMGSMCGADAKLVLKNCRYEEMVPGDGMWFKRGVHTYGYSVKKKD